MRQAAGQVLAQQGRVVVGTALGQRPELAALAPELDWVAAQIAERESDPVEAPAEIDPEIVAAQVELAQHMLAAAPLAATAVDRSVA